MASLDAGVSTAIRQLRPALGIRMLNVADIAVEDCRFTWAGEVGGNSIAFGAGIFASGGVMASASSAAPTPSRHDRFSRRTSQRPGRLNPLGQNKLTLVDLVKEQNLTAAPKSVTLGSIFKTMDAFRAMDQPPAAAKEAASSKEARPPKEAAKASSPEKARAISQEVLAVRDVNTTAIDINKLSAISSNGSKPSHPNSMTPSSATTRLPVYYRGVRVRHIRDRRTHRQFGVGLPMRASG